jgi:hypothetical protein
VLSIAAANRKLCAQCGSATNPSFAKPFPLSSILKEKKTENKPKNL